VPEKRQRWKKESFAILGREAVQRITAETRSEANRAKLPIIKEDLQACSRRRLFKIEKEGSGSSPHASNRKQ
jgi:hypothetical protein